MKDMTPLDWGIFGSSIGLLVAGSIWWHMYD